MFVEGNIDHVVSRNVLQTCQRPKSHRKCFLKENELKSGESKNVMRTPTRSIHLEQRCPACAAFPNYSTNKLKLVAAANKNTCSGPSQFHRDNIPASPAQPNTNAKKVFSIHDG